MNMLARFKLGFHLFGTEKNTAYQTLGMLAISIIPVSMVAIMALGLEGSRDIVTSLAIGAFLYINLLTIGFIYFLGGARKVTTSQG